VAYRRIGVPSIDDLVGAGVYYGSAATEVQARDPDAYEYMVGHRSDARVGYAVRLRRGEHRERADVLVGRASRVRVRGGDEFCINSDGEVSGPYRSMAWSIRPAALTMVLPPAGPAPAE